MRALLFFFKAQQLRVPFRTSACVPLSLYLHHSVHHSLKSRLGSSIDEVHGARSHSSLNLTASPARRVAVRCSQ